MRNQVFYEIPSEVFIH